MKITAKVSKNYRRQKMMFLNFKKKKNNWSKLKLKMKKILNYRIQRLKRNKMKF